MQAIQQHSEKRCLASYSKTFSRLANEETIIVLLSGEYLDVRDSTRLAMASRSISDTIRRCAMISKLTIKLPSKRSHECESDYAASSYVANRILSAAKTFARVERLEVSGSHSCNAYFDLTKPCQIREWCVGIHSEEAQNDIRASNMEVAKRFFQSLKSIQIEDVRKGFDDNLLAWMISLTRHDNSDLMQQQDCLEELSLIHCPCVHLDTPDNQAICKSLIFPNSLRSVRLDGCGIPSIGAIAHHFLDKCPRLSHLSILRTPAFLQWLKEGPLVFSRGLLSLAVVQNMLRSTLMLQEGFSKHSRSMKWFFSLLNVMENAQKEMNNLMNQIQRHLRVESNPPCFTLDGVKDALNRDKESHSAEKLMPKGINILQTAYCRICVTVIKYICETEYQLKNLYEEMVAKVLLTSSVISETDFVQFLNLFLKSPRGKISSIAAFFSERSDIFCGSSSRFRQLLSIYVRGGFGPLLFWQEIFPTPFNSLSLNRALVSSLRVSSPSSKIQDKIDCQEATVALTNIAFCAEGGSGCVPESQLLLSTAAVLPTCSAGTLEYLLRLGTNPNNRWGDANWFTPLMGAAQSGSSAKTLLLLEHGCDPQLECHNGSTALHFAIPSTSKYSSRTVRLLGMALGSKYISSYREGETGYTVLHRTALEAERLSVFKAVLSFKGIKDIVNVRCRWNGQSALQFACVESPDAHARVRMLLAAGASVDLRDKNGDTALLFCCRYFWLLNRNALVLRVLLEYGADRDARSRSTHETDKGERSTLSKSALDLLLHGNQKFDDHDKLFIFDVRKRATKLLTEYESPAMYTKRRRLGASPKARTKARFR